MKYFLLVCFFCLLSLVSFSQQDSVVEDYSEYDNVTYSDSKTKVFCNPKIFDLSPQRFISLAFDAQLSHNLTVSELGSYSKNSKDVINNEKANLNYVGGMRFFANIPVISKNNLLWQVGLNYWDVNYQVNNRTLVSPTGQSNLVIDELQKGLVTGGLHTTLYKPLNEKQFILFQGSADLSGNYSIANPQSLNYLRYSAALLWGKRPSDRKQWAIGISRTYRVGEMNYIPVVMFNWTSPTRKWGTEILFPARVHIRKNFSPGNLLLAGYELEGQSYRLNGLSDQNRSLELRRGELRFRAEFQKKLAGFIWGSFQGGYRYNYSYRGDELNNDGKEFFRGFFGTQNFTMINSLDGALYFQVGIHLVSP
jgi:hypothetical protein